MSGFFTAVALWMLGGYVGARIAAFLNRGNKLKFWGQIAAGLLGGIILGWLLDVFPLLQPITNFLHNGQVEDAISGLLGGLAFGTLGALFAPKEVRASREGGSSSADASVALWPIAGARHDHDGPADGSPGDSSGGSGGGDGGGGGGGD